MSTLLLLGCGVGASSSLLRGWGLGVATVMVVSLA